jgi:hypothetical protein
MKRPSPALVLSALALFVSLSGLGIAATGGNFILGQSNTADKQTLLTGTVGQDAQLRVQNASTGANSYGLFGKMTSPSAGAGSAGVRGLNGSTDASAAGVVGVNTGGGPGLKSVVNSGAPPLSVNSQTKVASLNADLLDGVDSTGLVPASVVFGDGSDGDATISSATALSRDMYYDNLTIATGQTLNPNGFRVFVSGTLTLQDGASIARNGNDGSSDPDPPVDGGAGLSSGSLGGSGAGAPGFCSDPGESTSNSLGGSGGGDATSIGANCPPGSATAPPASAGGDGVFRSAPAAISGHTLDGTVVTGGAGGGGWSGNDFGTGGGGGGVVVVAARKVVVVGAASITANGGAGSGPPAFGNAGGGGGGGVVVVISATPRPAGLTLSVSGGAGGPGGGVLPGLPGSPGFAEWLS